MVRYFLGTLIAALLFISCNSSSDSPVIVKKDNITTTFMVYLPGTDLESKDKNGTKNINAMMKVANSDKLNIIVQTGSANVTYAADDADKPVKDWKIAQRHKVTNSKITKLQDLGKSCINGATDGCLEMGSTAAIVDFIRYTVKNYPADRYIISLWDHGGGPIDGYGGDEVATIDMNQIMAAFEAVKKEVWFDIIGFDACLMGSLEIAYNLRHYGKYLLASEELEPGSGWNYEPPLSAIVKNPNISNSELAKILIDEFIKYNNQEGNLTLSLVDMSKTVALVAALEAFSTQASKISDTKALENWVNLFTARSQADEYDANVAKKQFRNVIDIGDFANMLKRTALSDYDATTTALNSALKDAVVYNRTDAAHANSKGLSLYFPYHFSGTPSPDIEAFVKYQNLFYTGKLASFSKAYNDLLTKLLTFAKNTATTFNILTVTPQANLVTAAAESNFGIESAVMLAETSTVPNQYKFFVSNVATVTRTGNTSSYNIITQKSNTVIALNGTPVYMEPTETYNRYAKNTYAFAIPAYITPAPVQGEAAPKEELYTLIGIYDFSKNEGTISATALPESSTGRDDITLKKGAKIVLADVVIDENRKKTTTKSTVAPIILNENAAHMLELAPFEITTNDKLVFLVKNLKGEPKISNFFKKDGTATTRSLMSEDSEEFLQKIADALNQPIK